MSLPNPDNPYSFDALVETSHGIDVYADDPFLQKTIAYFAQEPFERLDRRLRTFSSKVTAWESMIKRFLLHQLGEYGVMCPMACTEGLIALIDKFPEDQGPEVKWKMGTVEVPTAEITYDGARCYAVGPTHRGVANVVGIVLTLSRLTVGNAAVAHMTRAAREAQLYAEFRDVFGIKIGAWALSNQQVRDLVHQAQRSMAGAFKAQCTADPPFQKLDPSSRRRAVDWEVFIVDLFRAYQETALCEVGPEPILSPAKISQPELWR